MGSPSRGGTRAADGPLAGVAAQSVTANFDVKVTFGNGEAFSPNTRLYFREGTRSREIDLPGAARIIRRIDFFYRSALFGAPGRAIVHVYGRR